MWDNTDIFGAVLLFFSAVAFLALHAAEAALPLLRRGIVRESLPEKGVRAAAVRLLRQKRGAYEDVIWLLVLISVATTTGLTIGLTLGSLTSSWIGAVLALFFVWLVLLLAVPVVERLVRVMGIRALVTFGVIVQIGLWPLLPLRYLSQSGLRLAGRSAEALPPAPQAPAGQAESHQQDEEVPIEQEIAENPLGEREQEMVRGILDLEETTVREVMVPRVDVAALDVNTPLRDAVRRVTEAKHSRLPVYQDSADNIVGVLYTRDLLDALAKNGNQPATIREVMRPAFFVPESKRLDAMLDEFQEKRYTIAIVVDEYGGVAGIVSMEDVLEEIVGDIEDEFDVREVDIERNADGSALVDARIPIEDFNEEFGANINAEGFDTLGGYLNRQLGRIPITGDAVVSDNLRLQVESTVGRRVKTVRVARVASPDVAQQPLDVPIEKSQTAS